MWINAKHSVPSFVVGLPGPDITVPPHVVKLHFLPAEPADADARGRTAEVKGQLAGEEEVSVGGKTYRCQKIAGTMSMMERPSPRAETGEMKFEYLLSEEIPGKGYSFKGTGMYRGKKVLEETRLKKIEPKPPQK